MSYTNIYSEFCEYAWHILGLQTGDVLTWEDLACIRDQVLAEWFGLTEVEDDST